jgi:L-cystine uptake protein TcyP (sodium:dicarboxylate symporter family)
MFSLPLVCKMCVLQWSTWWLGQYCEFGICHNIVYIRQTKTYKKKKKKLWTMNWYKQLICCCLHSGQYMCPYLLSYPTDLFATDLWHLMAQLCSFTSPSVLSVVIHMHQCIHFQSINPIKWLKHCFTVSVITLTSVSVH